MRRACSRVSSCTGPDGLDRSSSVRRSAGGGRRTGSAAPADEVADDEGREGDRRAAGVLADEHRQHRAAQVDRVVRQPRRGGGGRAAGRVERADGAAACPGRPAAPSSSVAALAPAPPPPSEGAAAGAPGAAEPSAPGSAKRFSMHETNCCNSLSDTSCMTPRPNWAGLPVTARSVTTSIRVPVPDGASWSVTVAPAVPLPRLSLPFASMTARCVASSRLRNCPAPAYTRAIGPELDLDRPAEASSVTSVTVAPGKHGATPSRSMKVAQAVSIGAGR